tara:strand:+ start:1699 stop:2133 length:435 start_codon:yes stop_codon:yes gene_type:complete
MRRYDRTKSGRLVQRHCSFSSEPYFDDVMNTSQMFGRLQRSVSFPVTRHEQVRCSWIKYDNSRHQRTFLWEREEREEPEYLGVVFKNNVLTANTVSWSVMEVFSTFYRDGCPSLDQECDTIDLYFVHLNLQLTNKDYVRCREPL